MSVSSILLWSFAVYAVATGVYLISENRRPQATLAWLLVFVFAPVIGVLVYVFFGRNGKAFSNRTQLLMQDLQQDARPLLESILSRQNAEIASLEQLSTAHRKLMHLVRRNSHSALTTHNVVEVLQNADSFYANLLRDNRAANSSIHLQYFIWRSDPLTRPTVRPYCKPYLWSIGATPLEKTFSPQNALSLPVLKAVSPYRPSPRDPIHSGRPFASCTPI